MWGFSSRTCERDINDICENVGGWPELETAGNKRLSVWSDDRYARNGTSGKSTGEPDQVEAMPISNSSASLSDAPKASDASI
jgi:hypothetical protein